MTNERFEQIDKLSQAAKILDDNTYGVQINRMRESLSDSSYMLSVMGQFSAGKSRLLNNLLGKEALPVNITETTALITFVRYGENEHAELLLDDGSIEVLTIEEAQQIKQSDEFAEKLEHSERLTVYVDSALLKNGLIIADTPGINTIINRHVDLAAKIIENSDGVMYVMGKSVTETDINFVKGIIASGTEVTFVRTHMDLLKESEENISSTIETERNLLEEYTRNEVFFTSCEPDSKYYTNISELKKWITEKLAVDVAGAADRNAAARISFIACALKDKLVEKSASLSGVLTKNRETFVSEKEQIEKSLKEMERILDEGRKHLRDKLERTMKSATEEAKESCNQAAVRIRRELENISAGDSDKYKAAAESMLSQCCADIRREYISRFDKVLEENSDRINSELKDVSKFVSIDAIPDTLDESEYLIEEMSGEYLAVKAVCDELKSQIEGLNNQVEDAELQEEAIRSQKDILNQAYQQAQAAMKEFPPYVAQYVVVQEATHKGENGWRMAGRLLDWATLLIPGEAIASGAAKVLQMGAKAVNATSKAAGAVKAAAALEKGAAAITGAAKSAKKVDTALDIVKIIRQEDSLTRSEKRKRTLEEKKRQLEINRKAEKVRDVVEGYRTTKQQLEEMNRMNNENSTSLLDYLTIEHYFAQIGKKFDQPEVYDIDREYEKEYQKQHRALREQLQSAAHEEAQKEAELRDIIDKKEIANLEKKKLQQKLDANKVKFEKLRQKQEQEQRQAQLKALRTLYGDEAERLLGEFNGYIVNTLAKEVEGSIERYINTYDYSITKRINAKREELSKLLADYDTGDRTKLEAKLSDCAEYIKTLGGLIESVNQA